LEHIRRNSNANLGFQRAKVCRKTLPSLDTGGLLSRVWSVLCY